MKSSVCDNTPSGLSNSTLSRLLVLPQALVTMEQVISVAPLWLTGAGPPVNSAERYNHTCTEATGGAGMPKALLRPAQQTPQQIPQGSPARFQLRTPLFNSKSGQGVSLPVR